MVLQKLTVVSELSAASIRVLPLNFYETTWCSIPEGYHFHIYMKARMFVVRLMKITA
jgi:hypothetical protein